MANHRFVQQLYRELPTWVEQGLVSPDVPGRIQAYYGPLTSSGRTHLLITLFGILGGLLVGGGLILVIAHNWDTLPRMARTVLSFLPLVAAQVLAAWVLWKRNDRVAWREGGAGFLVLSIGAAMALVSQTYHISGTFDSFILTWTVLALPVVYVLRSGTAGLLYMSGMTAWMLHHLFTVTDAGWGSLLFLGILPYVGWVTRRQPYPGQASWLVGSVGLSAPIVLGVLLTDFNIETLWGMAYCLLFAVFFGVGRRVFADAPSSWQNPLLLIGGAGTLSLWLAFSYRWAWDTLELLSHPQSLSSFWGYTAIDIVGAGVCAALVIVWWMYCGVERRYLDGVWGSLPMMIVCGYVLGRLFGSLGPAIVLMNGYGLILGLSTLVAGVRGDRLSLINLGMLVLSGGLILRFFDSDLSRLFLGFVFMVLGGGFLGTNWVILQRRRASA